MRKFTLLTLSMLILGPTSLIPAKAQEDLVYVAVEPCRLADTRPSQGGTGAITAFSSSNFLVYGADLSGQGGNASGCAHPREGSGVEPSAISAYVVAVPTASSGAGHLTAYASDGTVPGNATATVNYGVGQVIGNTTNVTLCIPGATACPADGQMAIKAFTSEQNVVIDVQGYYYPVILDVNAGIVSTESDANLASTVSSEVVDVTCPTGSVMSGGGVLCGSDNANYSTTNYGVMHGNIPAGNGYVGSCAADALLYSTAKFGPPVTVYAVCLYDAGGVITAQAASAGVATVQAASVGIVEDGQDQPLQGEPSEETLLLLEFLRKEAAEREALFNSVN